MNKQIIFRGTEADVANLKVSAQERGLDVSGLIRQVLIQAKCINPVWLTPTISFQKFLHNWTND